MHFDDKSEEKFKELYGKKLQTSEKVEKVVKAIKKFVEQKKA